MNQIESKIIATADKIIPIVFRGVMDSPRNIIPTIAETEALKEVIGMTLDISALLKAKTKHTIEKLHNKPAIRP